MTIDRKWEIDITWAILDIDHEFKDHEYTSINHQYYSEWVCLYKTTLITESFEY